MANMDVQGTTLNNSDADSSNGPFKCSYCDKKFETKRELSHHKYNHQSNSKYTCQVCNKVFTSHEGLSRHSRVHQRGKKPIKCKLCKESFTMKLDLEEHHRDCHLEQKAFRCKVCGAEFSWEENLQKHQRMHMVDNYKCQYCDRVFCDTISLKIHQRHHKPVTKPPSPDCKPFSCSICAMRFQFDFSYKAHLNCHKVQGAGPPESENRTVEVLTHSAIDSSEKKLIAEFDMPDMKNRSKEVSVDICENTGGFEGATVRLKPQVEDDIFDHNAHLSRIPADKISIKVHNVMPYRSANKEISSYVRNSFVTKKISPEKSCEEEKTEDTDTASTIDEPEIKDEDSKSINNARKRKAYNGRYGELSMTEAKVYQCSLCKKSFRWEVSLKVHVEQHRSGAVKTIANGKAARKVKKAVKVFQKKNSPLKSQLVKRRAGSDDEEDDYIENRTGVSQPVTRKRTGVAKSATCSKSKEEISHIEHAVSTVVHLKKSTESQNTESTTYVNNFTDIVCITPVGRPIKVFEGSGIDQRLSNTVSNLSNESVVQSSVTSAENIHIGNANGLKIREGLKLAKKAGSRGKQSILKSGRNTQSRMYTGIVSVPDPEEEESDTAEDTQLYISIEPEQEMLASDKEASDSAVICKQPAQTGDTALSIDPSYQNSNDKSEAQQDVLQLHHHMLSENVNRLPPSAFGNDFIEVDDSDSVVHVNECGLVSQSKPFFSSAMVSVQPGVTDSSTFENVKVVGYSHNEPQTLSVSNHMQPPVAAETNHNQVFSEVINVTGSNCTFKPITSLSSIPEPPVRNPSETKISQLEKILMSGSSLPSVGTLSTLPATDSSLNQLTTLPARSSSINQLTILPATDSNINQLSTVPACSSGINQLSTLPCADSGINQQFVFSTLTTQSIPESTIVPSVSSISAVDIGCLTQNKEVDMAHRGNTLMEGSTPGLQNGLIQGNSGSLLNYIQSDSTQLLQGMATFMDNTIAGDHISQPAQYNGEINSINFTSGSTQTSVLNPPLNPAVNSTSISEVRQNYPKDIESKLQLPVGQQNCSGDEGQYIQSLQDSALANSTQYLSHDSHPSPFTGIPNVQAIQKMVQSLPAVPCGRSFAQNSKAVRKDRTEQAARNISQTIVNHQEHLVMANPGVNHVTQVSQPNTMLGSNLGSSDNQNTIHNMQIGIQSNHLLPAMPVQNNQGTVQSIQQTQMLSNVASVTSSVSAAQIHGSNTINIGVPSQGVVTASTACSQILENIGMTPHPLGVAAAQNTQLTANLNAKNILPSVQGRTLVLNNIQTVQNIAPNGVSGNLHDKTQAIINNSHHQVNNLQMVSKNVGTTQAENVINTNISNVAIIQGNMQQVPQNSILLPSLQNNVQYVQPAIQQGIMPMQAPVQAVGLGSHPEIRILGNIPNVLGTVHLQTGYVQQQVSCINEFGQVLAVTPLFQIPVDQNNLHQSIGGTFIQQTPAPLVQGQHQQQILAQPILGQQVVQNLPGHSSLANWQVSTGNLSQQCIASNVVNVVAGSGIAPSAQAIANQMTASSEHRSNQVQPSMIQDTLPSSHELIHVSGSVMSTNTSAVTSSPVRLSQLDGCDQKDFINPSQETRTIVKGVRCCFLCPKLLTSTADYMVHISSYHDRKKVTPCQHCGKCFQNIISWVRHRCKRLSKMCDICNKVLRNPYDLKLHKYNHGKVRRGIQCTVCRQKFLGINGVATHMKSHWAVPFYCYICKEDFTSFSNFTSHKQLGCHR